MTLTNPKKLYSNPKYQVIKEINRSNPTKLEDPKKSFKLDGSVRYQDLYLKLYAFKKIRENYFIKY